MTWDFFVSTQHALKRTRQRSSHEISQQTVIMSAPGVQQIVQARVELQLCEGCGDDLPLEAFVVCREAKGLPFYRAGRLNIQGHLYI